MTYEQLQLRAALATADLRTALDLAHLTDNDDIDGDLLNDLEGAIGHWRLTHGHLRLAARRVSRTGTNR